MTRRVTHTWMQPGRRVNDVERSDRSHCIHTYIHTYIHAYIRYLEKRACVHEHAQVCLYAYVVLKLDALTVKQP